MNEFADYTPQEFAALLGHRTQQRPGESFLQLRRTLDLEWRMVAVRLRGSRGLLRADVEVGVGVDLEALAGPIRSNWGQMRWLTPSS